MPVISMKCSSQSQGENRETIKVERFKSSLIKELLVVFRDRAGILLLFIMPLLLMTIMALIQDAPFRDFQENDIVVSVIDDDSGAASLRLQEMLTESGMISLSTAEAGDSAFQDHSLARITVPIGFTDSIRNNCEYVIGNALGLEGEGTRDGTIPLLKLEFEETLNITFRNVIKSGVDRAAQGVYFEILAELYSHQMAELSGIEGALDLDLHRSFIAEERHNPDQLKGYNSVQHNVPAYAVFGIFFIALTISGNLIRERDDGSHLRLKLIPGSVIPLTTGRITAYLLICLAQGIILFLAGIFIIPLVGLEALDLKGGVGESLLIIVCTGLVASGLGNFLGTVFRTQQQAAATGAILIILLAALGGIWVPIFAMPGWLQNLSLISPLNWSMSAFQDVLLRGGSWRMIMPEVISLLIGTIVLVTISMIISKRRAH
jgi:ABC-2 type transport system permease protein